MVNIITFFQRNSRTIALIGGIAILAGLILFNAIKHGI